MQHLEYRSELGLVFVRIDSDTMDKLVQKDDKRDSVLSESEENTVKALFTQAASDSPGAQVELDAGAPDDLPVHITRPEFMRRMREMQNLHSMGLGDMPDSFNVVVNTNHPVIAQTILKAEGAVQADLSAYLLQLALLQQGMLRGEALTRFVHKSIANIQP
jgi:molecular chaperone HtpG